MSAPKPHLSFLRVRKSQKTTDLIKVTFPITLSATKCNDIINKYKMRHICMDISIEEIKLKQQLISGLCANIGFVDDREILLE
jgi:hypothetical protein